MTLVDLPWNWICFNLFILVMLGLDLGVFHRKTHTVTFRESMVWTGVWITLALVFNGGVWHFMGEQKALEFFTGYVIEKSLSVDNVFVFALVFGYFAIPEKFQHKVLFWGILSALLMRAGMIGLGAVLVTKFLWITYVFGAFLILTGIKMLLQKGPAMQMKENPVVKLIQRWIPVTETLHGDRFFIKEGGMNKATPLFVALILVELSDVLFAVDSIPAIFAVTKDPFIVYTSNVFAILGLRSLYFALAGVMDKFHYLKTGLGVVLSFVGVKMILGHSEWKIDTGVSLLIIMGILGASIALSLLRPLRPLAPAETR